jgi:eukaryotic-like serine/threonine-protein kinase
MTIPVVAGFVDLEPIGSGGIGDVYRATRESTHGLVALKFLRKIDDASSSWRRVQRELAALVELKGHPHVVGVEEVLTTAYGPLIVMEYAPGGTVSALIRNRGAGLHPAEVLLIGRATRLPKAPGDSGSTLICGQS